MEDNNSSRWTPLRKRTSSQELKYYLKILVQNNYRFIPLSEAVDMISGNIAIQPNSVCLTFDDGYRNNITHALPILRDYNAPATFFVITEPVENRIPFWFDRADYALQNLAVKDIKMTIGNEDFVIKTVSQEEMLDTYTRLRLMYRKHSLAEIMTAVDEIDRAANSRLEDLGANDDWTACLRWDEIRQLVKEGFVIGSHTLNHFRLDDLNDESALNQLISSKAAIEEEIDTVCEHFSYPSGLYNASTPDLVKQAGYRSAVTTIPGGNYAGDDVYRLKRINIESNLPDKLLEVIKEAQKQPDG